MTGPEIPPAALARLLRQRAELGVEGWILEGMTGEEALDAIRRARSEVQAPTRSEMGAPARRSAESTAGVPAPPAPGAPATPAAALPDEPAPGLPADHEELRTIALACTRCPLSRERTQVVFSDGNPDARLVVVGEAPGANEDRTGLPFVGAAGKLLDLLLASVDLSRQTSVYICNVIKCRPPGNRNPLPDEIEMCSPYLRRQIELVGPEAILAVGTFAARLLTGSDQPLGQLRGKVHSYQDTPLVVTYHPAALLRNSGWIRPTWDDLQMLCRLLDSREQGKGNGSRGDSDDG